MAWIARDRLPRLQTVEDLSELLQVIESEDLTEFQYLVDGEDWTVSVK